MATYLTPRRAYLIAFRRALYIDTGACVDPMRAIHDAITPATPFTSATPYQDQLRAACYTAIEDLDGADVDELTRCAGLTARQAAEVLASVA